MRASTLARSARFGRVGRGLSRDKYSLITRYRSTPLSSFLPSFLLLVYRSLFPFLFFHPEKSSRIFPRLGCGRKKTAFRFTEEEISISNSRFFPSLSLSPSVGYFQASFLSHFLALISTLFFSPQLFESFVEIVHLGDFLAHLSASSDFSSFLFGYLLYFPFFLFFLFLPLISATFVRAVSSSRFKIRFELPNFFPPFQGEDSSSSRLTSFSSSPFFFFSKCPIESDFYSNFSVARGWFLLKFPKFPRTNRTNPGSVSTAPR